MCYGAFLRRKHTMNTLVLLQMNAYMPLQFITTDDSI
jgi:hypothetical protein